MSTLVSMVRLLPQTYLHVLDNTTNVTRVEMGPKTLVVQRHESMVGRVEKMITVPPRHFLIVANPVIKDEDSHVVYGDKGLALLRLGEKEVRLAQDPFPLYPGETVFTKTTKLQMVYKNEALHLTAKDNFTDHRGVRRSVGDEYQFIGPGQYVPHTKESVLAKVRATVIKENQALRLSAKDAFADRKGVQRVAGEDWIVPDVGAYLPHVYEETHGLINARVLTDKKALHIKALRTFTDSFGKKRKCHEEWLLTNAQTEAFIPSENEEVAREVRITTLTSRQYCTVVNPFDADKGVNAFGHKRLVTGEKSFFLHPGEFLERGIENVFVLNEEEGLVLSCEEAFSQKSAESGELISRKAGDRWMIKGPMEYIPPVGAKVLRVNRAIALGDNEGVYLRNVKTGEVRAVIGSTYLMNENEEKWEKILPPVVDEMLATGRGFCTTHMKADAIRTMKAAMAARDKTRVVSYNVPHNHAVQVFDFKESRGRCVFGPALVLLEPGEIITALCLSGGKPKRANVLKSLHLRLGPEFSSDLISVETSDHCKLNVSLSYNWQFAVKTDGTEEERELENAKLFAVEDFIGELCKTMSSRIRAATASVAFEDFHKTSAKLIRSTIFGVDENGKIKDKFEMHANNLVVTGVDIRSIEPDDARTRQALQKSVQLAIEITAKTQEAVAKHLQASLEQQAKGKLERQRLVDSAEAEVANRQFMQAQVETKAVKNTGKARAEAQSSAEMTKIAAAAAVEQATLEAEASGIEFDSALSELRARRKAELQYLKEKYALDESATAKTASIELKKFKEIVAAVGAETLQAIYVAGPELQRKLLKGLGLDASLLQGSLPFVD